MTGNFWPCTTGGIGNCTAFGPGFPWQKRPSGIWVLFLLASMALIGLSRKAYGQETYSDLTQSRSSIYLPHCMDVLDNARTYYTQQGYYMRLLDENRLGAQLLFSKGRLGMRVLLVFILGPDATPPPAINGWRLDGGVACQIIPRPEPGWIYTYISGTRPCVGDCTRN